MKSGENSANLRTLLMWPLICVATAFPQQVPAEDAGDVVRAAVAKVAPSVVRIRLIGNPGGDELAVTSRVTTGLVISEDGFVLTSAFGLTGQVAGIFVETADGTRATAHVVATDHVRKLVLLKCEEGKFTPPAYVDKRWPDVGATSIAVGRMYPAATPSVSVGIVSAVNRIFGLAVQTDAKISPVNYGGPLIDLEGHVLGVLVPLSPSDAAEAIDAGVEWYDSGIGFAIPAADALQVADQLRKGDDRSRGTLGIRLSTRNPLATEFDIALVHPDSPASKSGLQKGDVIAEVNGVKIERFGILESIVKSSYVGDRMSLVIRRGEAELPKELILAAPLSRPPRGFLGVIVGDEVKADDDRVLGVAVQTLPGSVLAAAGVPQSAVLSSWDGESLASERDLIKALANSFAGHEVELTWFASHDDQTPVTVQVTPVQRPATLTELSAEARTQIVGPAAVGKWQRGEKDLGENEGRVWFYAPEEAAAGEFGAVVLLSEGNTPQETVLKRWADICESQNLLLVVPVSPEQTGLTREHRALILKAVATVAAGRTVQADRSFLVASSQQSEVCTELILQLRQRQFSAAVFVDTWPQVSGVATALLSVAAPATLVLNVDLQSRQRLALQQQAVRTLQEAGAWVIQQSVSSDDDAAELMKQWIASWALNLKIQ